MRLEKTIQFAVCQSTETIDVQFVREKSLRIEPLNKPQSETVALKNELRGENEKRRV